MWEVVYEKEDYGGGYGFAKVGIKTPDCRIVWFASSDDQDKNRYGLMEYYVKEICQHMNGMNTKAE